jgi:hypothetical protein
MGSTGAPQSKRLRKLYAVAKEIGLTDDERIDLAQMVLRRDITSWGQLDETQVCRLLDCIEGYQLISELEAQRVIRS